MIQPRNVDPRPASEDIRRLDIASLPKPPAWMSDAACIGMDPDLFFPSSDRPSTPQAREIVAETCRTCRVRSQCLDYAIGNNEQYGTWSGKSFSTSERPKASDVA